MPNIKNNENLHVCSKCNGGCCKQYGGAYHPDDFKEPITYELLDSLIGENDTISIDWYECDDCKGFFLRPRHVNGGKVDPSWGDACIHFTDGVGCSLKFDDRPYGCRSLVPSPDENGSCREGCFGKEDAYNAWKPYHDILQKLYDKYNATDYNQSGEIDPFSRLLMAIIGCPDD